MSLTSYNVGMFFTAQLLDSCDPKQEGLPKITTVKHLKKI